MHRCIKACAIILALTGCTEAFSTTAELVVQADKPGPRISPTLFGIFFEEINHAGDGGLYAELVRNRGFEEPNRTNAWVFITSGTASGSFSTRNTDPVHTANPNYGELWFISGTGQIGVANLGYWGMNFQAGQVYNLSVYARRSAGFGGQLIARLENASGSQIYAQQVITNLTLQWRRYTLELIPNASDPTGRLALAINQPGTVWFDAVSLFPRATFKNRPNGLRSDLMGMLTNLRPAFVRFPGGCFIEGDYLTNAFRWKKTIGDIIARPGHWNAIWNYFSSDGLGFHEYLQMCEDLGAEPLFVINCGMAHNETAPMAQMGEFVQDALDAIEYANGPTNSFWGALRAAHGHPEPFNLKYIQIGNENGGPAYNERYALFYDAIKSNYPHVQIVACNWGGLPTSRPVEISDEHYYSSPAFFIQNATRYDTYPRTGPKIYVGEFAVTSGCGNGNLRAALAEAAFMTGLERNSDIVVMASYAPLLANLNAKNWNPDLIYFTSSQVFGTPSYYVQQMFAHNRGDVVLPVTVTITPAAGANPLARGAIGVGAWNTQVQFTNIVVTSNGITIFQSDFAGQGTNGWRLLNGTWSVTNGLLQQSAIATDCRATTGNTNWANYTLTLRARKIAGSEGFLILFNWLDDNNWAWWNLGGWNNTQHAIEWCFNGRKTDLSTRVPGSIETNKWYDIRIELNGLRVRCHLDGILVHDVSYPASPRGNIGLGTWNTRASFTNLMVTKAGQVLYQSDFHSGAQQWQVYRGSWSTTNGVYRQTAILTDCRSTTGNTNWSDYTISLRARKDGGAEGFLIIFNRLDDDNWTWWNIGGWNNTQHAIEVCEAGAKSILGTPVPGSITTNRWYDIRIVQSGGRIQCYLDNVLVHDVAYPALPALVASASYASNWGQVILKAANVTDSDLVTTVKLAGLNAIAPVASATILTSSNWSDENTLEEPHKVAPIKTNITNAAPVFIHPFPARSFSVMRLQLPPLWPTPIGFGLTNEQIDAVELSNGIPVRLGSFITNSVNVKYVIETPEAVMVTDTLQFDPGQLVKTIPLQPWMVQTGRLTRVRLVDPVNGVVNGHGRVYILGPTPTTNLPWLGCARFEDETLLYWSGSDSKLQRAEIVTGPWVVLHTAQSPYRLEFTNRQSFYRLVKTQ
ncbi:MAG: hypothetical protein N2379_04550 [Verrucomicrobiae bacterium]|nr:hypothetical protein [Verrucomicrobiae bacterium]